MGALTLAKLTPIYKNKGDREPSNFRHILQLPTFSKLIEKAAHLQFREYQNKTFENKQQFANKKAHSTVHPIILIRHVIEKHLKNKKCALLIVIDLSLAFDCIETSSILPNKLKHYGADPITTSPFQFFFHQ